MFFTDRVCGSEFPLRYRFANWGLPSQEIEFEGSNIMTVTYTLSSASFEVIVKKGELIVTDKRIGNQYDNAYF